ncbi:uncharacterized protein LOC108089542 [Drosophila ficusphila]|uniref:uncharacterized protein LOC108089542 n=1 Tax=Drosophila ficusphila TaxID=30025 RepID=UPI001C896A1C|nr:uncharacterized protein LOC108089542 [Drosophila ficusphila]
MYKLVVFFALLAIVAARPGYLEAGPLLHSYAAPAIIHEPALAKVGAIIKTVPSAVSHQSISQVHSSAHIIQPIVAPVLKTYAAPIIKTYAAPALHTTLLSSPWAGNGWAGHGWAGHGCGSIGGVDHRGGSGVGGLHHRGSSVGGVHHGSGSGIADHRSGLYHGGHDVLHHVGRAVHHRLALVAHGSGDAVKAKWLLYKKITAGRQTATVLARNSNRSLAVQSSQYRPKPISKMFKLVVLSALLAVAVARPGHLLESSPLVYAAPAATTIVQEPVLAKVGAVVKSVPTSVSHQSQSVVHSSAHVVEDIVAPVVKSTPVVSYAAAAPVVHTSYSAAPVVHTSYAAPAPVVHTSYAAAAPVLATSYAQVAASSPLTYTATGVW